MKSNESHTLYMREKKQFSTSNEQTRYSSLSFGEGARVRYKTKMS